MANKRKSDVAESLKPEPFEDHTPIPTRPLCNGEFTPQPRTQAQKQVEVEIKRLGTIHAKKRGMDRRRFLHSSASFATAFLAMNGVFGEYFAVSEAEASGELSPKSLSDQFIMDVHLHFAEAGRNFSWAPYFRRYIAQRGWDPTMKGQDQQMEMTYFRNFVKEVFFDSDTKVGVITNGPGPKPTDWFISNDNVFLAKDIVNDGAKNTRLLGHATIQPRDPAWLDEIDRAIEVLKPDAWKGYTIGSIGAGNDRLKYRLDDEDLMYPAYEKFVKAGVRNVCIHKGLIPNNFMEDFPGRWRYATVDDVPKAARDWPELNFVIYHAALNTVEPTESALEKMEQTGQLDWVSDLAEIPEKYGVNNVYCDIAASFGLTAMRLPRLCAAMLGILVRGLGPDKILWGTDSVWYGSPQWQIEAFRRIEIPADMRKNHGFAELGEADGPIKSAILGRNAARLYGINPDTANRKAINDTFTRARQDYLAAGEERSNIVHGLLSGNV